MWLFSSLGLLWSLLIVGHHHFKSPHGSWIYQYSLMCSGHVKAYQAPLKCLMVLVRKPCAIVLDYLALKLELRCKINRKCICIESLYVRPNEGMWPISMSSESMCCGLICVCSYRKDFFYVYIHYVPSQREWSLLWIFVWGFLSMGQRSIENIFGVENIRLFKIFITIFVNFLFLVTVHRLGV